MQLGPVRDTTILNNQSMHWGSHLFKLREQSSWLSSLCICILCVDLCHSSWNRSMLLLSQNQITKWRISDFINLGLNFKGLFWTRFIHFADRMEQPCLLSVKELGCRTFLLPFLAVCTSYLHMCEEWLSMKSQIFFGCIIIIYGSELTLHFAGLLMNLTLILQTITYTSTFRLQFFL